MFNHETQYQNYQSVDPTLILIRFDLESEIDVHTSGGSLDAGNICCAHVCELDNGGYTLRGLTDDVC